MSTNGIGIVILQDNNQIQIRQNNKIFHFEFILQYIQEKIKNEGV